MTDSWAEIRLPIFRENLAAIRRTLPAAVELIAMLKADAYGHGLAFIGPAAWEAGVRRFALFHLDEAVQLRRLLPHAALLMVGVAQPRDVEALLEYRIQPLIVDADQARALAAEAAHRHACLPVHAKIDTGMGRLGFLWEEASRTLPQLARLPGIRLEGAGTHLASAGADDRAFADLQIARFRQVVRECEAGGLPFPLCHAANSDGFCRADDWHFQAIRPGILLYGYGPPPPALAPPTRPVLQWKTRLIQVRSIPAGFPVSYDSTYRAPRATRLGTLPVGYADGYFRAWSNKAAVLVGGRRAPVAGRVTMNLTMVDLGPDSPAQPGDEAVLLGEQAGASLWADELADLAGTLSYEVLTAIRSPRFAVDDAHAHA